MAFNDPIAEFLTKVRNAQHAQHKYVDIVITKMNVSMTNILKEHGFIDNFIQNENKRRMRLFLKYSKTRKGVIKQLKRISKPGRRVYKSYDKLPRILNGIGIAIVTTSKGVLDDYTARGLKVGGEVLCYVW